MLLFYTAARWAALDFCAGALAGVAQLVEQLICNQQVGGSRPFASSIFTFYVKAALWICYAYKAACPWQRQIAQRSPWWDARVDKGNGL